MKQTITIADVEYEKRPEHTRSGSKLAALVAVATMCGVQFRDRPAPTQDLVAEFALIQEKKSKLSRRDREWVEAEFHRKYVKSEPDRLL